MSSVSSTTYDPSLQPSAGSHDKAVAPGEIAVGVIIGRASENFDLFVFGIAAVLVFPSVFFPLADRLTGSLYSFAIFSFAFIARPFGTLLFMAIERHAGRSVKMTVALFLMGTATAGIAFLPGYLALGEWSVVMLSVLRVLQGIAQGGSWDGLPSLLALNAPARRKGWYAMIPQLGAPVGFVIAALLFAFLYSSLPRADFLDWGWRYPFYVAFAINVVALFARLRLIATDEYEEMLNEAHLSPNDTGKMLREQGYNLWIGAFAALASYALFHLVTVFPLSWILLYSSQSIPEFLLVQCVGAALAVVGMIFSGWIADFYGRRSTLGGLAALIAVFSGYVPTLLDGGRLGQDVFMLLGFFLLGLSYGQASGSVTSNFSPRYRYVGAALTNDLAWLIGAAFAPLVALGLSAHLGLGYVSLYLLSGAVSTLLALRANKLIERS